VILTDKNVKIFCRLGLKCGNCGGIICFIEAYWLCNKLRYFARGKNDLKPGKNAQKSRKTRRFTAKKGCATNLSFLQNG